MKSIDELLKLKGKRPIYSVGPDDTVFAAVAKMVEMNVGAMLVIVDGVSVGSGDTVSIEVRPDAAMVFI